MLAMSRDLGVQYKTSFVLAHKMREAMATEVRTQPIGGEGKRAEIDGGYFGGYVKPAISPREPPRSPLASTPVRQTQGRGRYPRERDGRTLPGVFHSEVEALAFIRRQVARGTELYADEASAWNALHARYTLHRVNHEEAYSLGGEYEINTNSAELFSPACGAASSDTITTSLAPT